MADTYQWNVSDMCAYWGSPKYRVIEYYRVCRFIDVILELKLTNVYNTLR